MRDALDGTFAPFSRASLSPMAIACLRLVTFRPEPLFSVPLFFRCIADLTVFDAALPYFAIAHLRVICLQRTCWQAEPNVGAAELPSQSI